MKPVGKASKLSELPSASEGRRRARQPRLNQAWRDAVVLCGLKRWFVVALAVNVFFIVTLLANGMTVRYFNLYFTQVMKFSPTKLCLLNMVCRFFIAGFVQLAKPLTRSFGRTNVAIVLHLASAMATLGIYGGGFFTPTPLVACGCYLMRFACLQTRDPILTSITMDLVPENQRSRWSALNSLRSLSFSASAVLGGYLADEFGYEFSFSVTVAALLASTVIMLPSMIWFPRKEGDTGDSQGENLLSITSETTEQTHVAVAHAVASNHATQSFSTQTSQAEAEEEEENLRGSLAEALALMSPVARTDGLPGVFDQAEVLEAREDSAPEGI
eukprot:TRINITY_DN23849_c0_g1_i1.p1 TRINITY_DN23849_c0_g1~~TRINITY_DN23849_c0_g1_i1.p1  ORF type:complete len:329 (-),score=43.07 TRINITY_DN23849_c0_g1_i1:19-1005(-)